MPAAFILMPFDPEFAPIYEQLIQPSLEEAGYDVARADSFVDQRNILQDIVEGISSADLVIAEITTLNPNVLYELGIAHGLERPTILLAQSIEDVPFDLRSYRIVTYSTSFTEVAALKDTLKDIATRHAAGELRFGSPVTDFASGKRPRPYAPAAGAATAELELDPPSDDEPAGFLEQRATFEEAAESIGGYFAKITELSERISETFTETAEHAQAATANPGPGSARQMLVHAHRVAVELTRYRDTVREITPEFSRSVEAMVEPLESGVLVASEEDYVSGVELVSTSRDLKETTRDNVETVKGVRDQLRELASLHITREVTRAALGAADALDGWISVLEQLEAFAERSAAVVELRLAGWRRENPEPAQAS